MLQRILAHAAKEPGREVCGLLFASNKSVRTERSRSAGHERAACSPSFDFAQDERITGTAETANVAPDPSTTFEIDPAALFSAVRAERTGGPCILGHYHSHPNGSATPSARDAAMAFQPGRLWLIVAAGEARMWREQSGGAMHGAFDPVELVVDGADDGCT
ncbi:M67 family metallopeptidase [Sphingomonas oryzagri]|uniref:M67 family metallopeptidase n=1 Tax=Sphingomonas oryzagri TaxID=3042314 RepID=A0ABT6N189_9SPHN|nr:M67 family metallopeptidase [Sphingomonas oryzagri]MDH7638524.1 M67 family metallopeptidase [Sphingomonas oryzagri]